MTEEHKEVTSPVSRGGRYRSGALLTGMREMMSRLDPVYGIPLIYSTLDLSQKLDTLKLINRTPGSVRLDVFTDYIGRTMSPRKRQKAEDWFDMSGVGFEDGIPLPLVARVFGVQVFLDLFGTTTESGIWSASESGWLLKRYLLSAAFDLEDGSEADICGINILKMTGRMGPYEVAYARRSDIGEWCAALVEMQDTLYSDTPPPVTRELVYRMFGGVPLDNEYAHWQMDLQTCVTLLTDLWFTREVNILQPELGPPFPSMAAVNRLADIYRGVLQRVLSDVLSAYFASREAQVILADYDAQMDDVQRSSTILGTEIQHATRCIRKPLSRAQISALSKRLYAHYQEEIQHPAYKGFLMSGHPT